VKPRDQKIRMQPSWVAFGGGVDVQGCYAGRASYLCIRWNHRAIARFEGQALYRFAKAIVRHWEEPSDE
jgi:hypothetical protein